MICIANLCLVHGKKCFDANGGDLVFHQMLTIYPCAAMQTISYICHSKLRKQWGSLMIFLQTLMYSATLFALGATSKSVFVFPPLWTDFGLLHLYLQAPILTHTDGELQVNADQQIPRQIQEAKWMLRMKLEIPDAAKLLLSKEKQFKHYKIHLEQCLHDYKKVGLLYFSSMSVQYYLLPMLASICRHIHFRQCTVWMFVAQL